MHRRGPKPKKYPENCPKCGGKIIQITGNYHRYNHKQKKCMACCLRVETRKDTKKYFPPDLVSKVISSYLAGDSIHKISADLDAMRVSSVYTILRNNGVVMRTKSVAIRSYWNKRKAMEIL